MNPKLLCVIFGIAALVMSGIYMMTLNFLALAGCAVCFILFQVFYWKQIRKK